MALESKHVHSTHKVEVFIFTDLQIPVNTQTTIRPCRVGLIEIGYQFALYPRLYVKVASP